MSSEPAPRPSLAPSSPLPGAGSKPLSPTRRRTIDEIVRILLPENPGPADGDRERVRIAVTDFVVSQIEAMPTFIGIPYRAAVSGFELLAIARFGRVFLALSDAEKASYLAAWADAPVGPARDFVKMIRSCALLAYFDHPDVARHLPGSAPHAA